jgi:AcrR family transcriptional regulator
MTTAATPVPTRDRLVDTARAYLDQEGVDGIGLREIARRAGVSHGAPLRHFPSLGALLAAVGADGFRDLYASVDAAVRNGASDDPRVRLKAAAHGYVDFARAHPGVFELMFRSDLCDTADPDYATAGGMAFGQLVALVADAQAAGLRPELPAAEFAGVVWATVHGIASLHLHGALAPTTGQPDVDVLVDIATSLLVPTTT